MNISKIYLVLFFISVTTFLYSCDSVTDGTQQNKIQSQNLTIDSNAKKEKADICHLDDEGNYMLISIAEPALDAHLNHGDGVPGGEVPGQPNHEFDDTCTPEPAGVQVPPCFAIAIENLITLYPETIPNNFNTENYTGWSFDVDDPDFFVRISTPLNSSNLRLGYVSIGDFLECFVAFPIPPDGEERASSHFGSYNVDEHYVYLKYLETL